MSDAEIEVYRAALNEARTSFDTKTKRKAKIQVEEYDLDKDLVRLRRTITALAAMCSESPWLDPLGITESCSKIMEVETSELTTQEVMKKLEGIGFDLSSQKNPAASVHTVLSRLSAKEKISKIHKDDDEVAWRGPRYSPDDDIPF
jgi:hypothetical protein